MLDRRGRETYVEVGDGPESEGVRDGLMRTSQDSSGRLSRFQSEPKFCCKPDVPDGSTKKFVSGGLYQKLFT